MKIIVIGGLTNGKILIDYFSKKKDIEIKLLITHPFNKRVPRIVNFNYLKKRNIKVINDLNANKYYSLIKKINPDLIFLLGWSGMLSEKLIKTPKFGVIGFHPSKLPAYRGRSVIAWQLEEGEKESAYTAFFVDKKPDSGDILLQQKFIIKSNDYVVDVLDKVDLSLVKMLPKIHKMMKEKNFIRTKQNIKKGFYKKLRNDSNSLVTFDKKAREIFNKIRAVSYPYPGAFLKYKNKKYQIWKSEILPKYKNLNINKKCISNIIVKKRDYFIVQTRDYPIKMFLKKSSVNVKK
jgi:methionyl-tRNA formyltransferase